MGNNSYNLEGKRIWVSGHRGMVGSALVRRLQSENCEILTVDRDLVDLTRQAEVEDWMAETKPQAVFIAAAKVGGILANDKYSADFIYNNLMIEANIIHAAHRVEVEKLLFLGSSCIYPKFAKQPISEDQLLTGPLEPTNEWYAVAKIAGIKLCQAYRKQYNCNFIAAMPTNLYGPGDNYDLDTSHVIPALLRKAHEAKVSGAKELTVWGTGTPRREFLYVDDLADALVFLLLNYAQAEHVNVGCGEDITIAKLAELIAQTTGFSGRIVFDASKPDGTPRKLLDVAKLKKLGWTSKTLLSSGLTYAYSSFLEEYTK